MPGHQRRKLNLKMGYIMGYIWDTYITMGGGGLRNTGVSAPLMYLSGDIMLKPLQ